MKKNLKQFKKDVIQVQSLQNLLLNVMFRLDGDFAINLHDHQLAFMIRTLTLLPSFFDQFLQNGCCFMRKNGVDKIPIDLVLVLSCCSKRKMNSDCYF